MGRVKAHYHEYLTMLDQTQPEPLHIPSYPEQAMTEQELEAYLDHLYAEYQAKEDAYKFEDNYEPFETKPRD